MRIPLSLVALGLAVLGVPASAGAQVSELMPPSDLTAPPPEATKSASGLISKVLTPGTSAEKPVSTDIVTVNYTGWTSEGRMFDSTVTRRSPSTFPLSRVMAGWEGCAQLMAI